MAERPCHCRGTDVPVTLSVGVCQYDGQSKTEDFVLAADAALYAAKSDINQSPVT
jgi:GGDEF domain-containing protein